MRSGPPVTGRTSFPAFDVSALRTAVNSGWMTVALSRPTRTASSLKGKRSEEAS